MTVKLYLSFKKRAYGNLGGAVLFKLSPNTYLFFLIIVKCDCFLFSAAILHSRSTVSHAVLMPPFRHPFLSPGISRFSVIELLLLPTARGHYFQGFGAAWVVSKQYPFFKWYHQSCACLKAPTKNIRL